MLDYSPVGGEAMFDFTWLIQALGLGARIWFGLTLACVVLVFGPQFGWTFLNGIGDAWINVAKVGLVLFGSLSVVTVLSTVWSGIRWGGTKAVGWNEARMSRRAAEEAAKASAVEAEQKKAQRTIAANKAIDELTEREREILAYLVTRGERHFTTTMDGGFAAGLLGRGIVRMSVVGGQSIDMLVTPFSVDPDIWQALLERKGEFVHPKPNGRPPYVDSPF
jgi:hypothetical protein